MSTFVVDTKLNQIVTKNIVLTVEAANEEIALEKVREALNAYPDPITTEGIRTIYTQGIKHWIPRDIEIVEIKEEKRRA